jgi:hypothetical protein
VRGVPSEPDIRSSGFRPATTNTWESFRSDVVIPLGVTPTSYEVVLSGIKFGATPVNMSVDSVSLHPKPL